MRRPLAALCLALIGWPALAEAPDRSLRPVPRPEAVAAVAPAPAASVTRPRARPAAPPPVAQPAPAPRAAPPSDAAVASSPRPDARPSRLFDRLFNPQPRLPGGSVCNDPAIKGERIGRVAGKSNGCGIEDAVRVTSVSGVRLSTAATIDCETAKALNRWVENGMQLSLRPKGQVAELRVAASYACRPRNNQSGGRISEHGRGRAIDISAFVMRDGEVITVLDHWDKRGYRDVMRRLHRTACGVFGTVLGPDSDRFHKDHFHFDTARYRNGSYCR